MVRNQIQDRAPRAKADGESMPGFKPETQDNRLEVSAGAETQPQGQKKKLGTKKPAPDRGPVVPAYTLEKCRSYDISGTHTSVKSAEYTGYETIGRLVLYCFLSGEQPYRFSELSVLQGGGIQNSGTGEEVPPAETDVKRKHGRFRNR